MILILGGIIFIVFLVLSLKFHKIRLFFSLVSGIFLIILVSLMVLSFFVFQDAEDFKTRFQTEEKRFILVDEDRILAGLVIESFDSANIEPFPVNGLSYDEDSIDVLLGSSWKLFVVKAEYIEPDIIYNSMTREEILNILKQDSINISNSGEFETEDEARAKYFAMLLDSMAEAEGPYFISERIVTEKMIIYPESLMFKIIKKMPRFLTSMVEKKIGDK